MEIESSRLMQWYKEQGITVEHPVVKLPSEAQVRGLLAGGATRAAELKELLEKREKLIRLMKVDPLRYGWEPPEWKDARRVWAERSDLLLMGGNRSTKTQFASREAVADMVSKPKRRWAFLHNTEDSAKILQHPRIYEYLPPEWRDLGKRGKSTFIIYTEQRGFSDNQFILPNGSRGFFFNYHQDPKVLEGHEFDGVWADELIPAEFLVALRFRLVTREGRLLVTFTPVEGYPEATVGDYLSAAQVMEYRRSELLPDKNVAGVPPGNMPYIMRCVHPRRAVMFFFTEINRFSSYERMKQELGFPNAPAPKAKIKVRAYGYPEQRTGVQFPKFGPRHICPVSKVPQEGTDYWYGDFAWNRNWFMIWLRVTEWKGRKRVIVWKEWPEKRTHGEWVLPSSQKKDGEKGPAQSKSGMGWTDYKRLLRDAEKAGAKVYEYRGDPRSGAQEMMTEESGGTCTFDKMREEFTAEDGTPEEGFDVLASRAGRSIQEGITLLDGWMAYNPEAADVIENEPVLVVSEACENVIDCLRMWTGADGQKGASKDPIDLLRYAALDDVCFVEEGVLGSSGGGTY